ncbi:hypothetical protein B0T26DRAFT_787953 [Lasiosphaeria miniovina]|uniref:Uncharacterized protein n=1 Tax=Lasiosphaeria miniovina TaxID=1954250 RepID=A0AA40DJG3_9PEZI|nr:uncharacterized protein B0T26DRAFT_787953 [Lasiosphaeria miniovina]KAK0705859.1 hypothetical protein B0T26DRAFT_787953 [Lasiosphaeria miniovina]
MIKSPASLTSQGCGNLIASSNTAQCKSSPLSLQKTFMVQFCCGSAECLNLGIPIKRSSMPIRGHTPRQSGNLTILGSRAAAGLQSMYMTFANGTIITPLEVGSPTASAPASAAASPSPAAVQRRCDGWQEGSYKPNAGEDGDFLKTTDTMLVSAGNVPINDSAYTFTNTYSSGFETTTGFSVSLGDPFGIINLGVSFEFANQTSKQIQYSVGVPAGVTGRVGFTPVYHCSKGSMTQCDGTVVENQESCTPFLTGGDTVQGDYSIVQIS